MSRCRGCGREIDWIVTAAFKRMPVDPEPRRVAIDVDRMPGEETLLGMDANGVAVQGIETSEPLGPSSIGGEVVEIWISHFSTCPKAGTFRGRGRR